MPEFEELLARERAAEAAVVARAQRDRVRGGPRSIPSSAYAGFWIRVVALLIDELLLLALFFLLLKMVGGPASVIVFLIVIALYFPLMESSGSQGTIGKGMCALAVTETSGYRISFLRALVRLVGRLAFNLLFGLGYLLVAFTPRKRGLHDYIAGTVVLRRGLY
jgi:uncharacterized RDD family membrane protein YckC